MRRSTILAVASVVVVLLGAAGLAAFQPWKLWVDQRADEPVPVTVTAPRGGGGPGAATTAPASGTLFQGGTWRSYSHGETTGTIQIYRLGNGSHVLRLQNLRTSNGPDVKVVLSARPYDSQANLAPGYLILGTLKGNEGSSNYAIPPGTELNRYQSVVIWCKRFDAVFAAASIV